MSDSEKEGDKKITQLPLARIKRLMKTVPTEMGNLSTESVVLITRATELFLEHFAEQGAKNITSGKGTLKYEDLAAAVHSSSALSFLDEIVPQKVMVSDLPPAPALP